MKNPNMYPLTDHSMLLYQNSVLMNKGKYFPVSDLFYKKLDEKVKEL